MTTQTIISVFQFMLKLNIDASAVNWREIFVILHIAIISFALAQKS